MGREDCERIGDVARELTGGFTDPRSFFDVDDMARPKGCPEGAI
ncbi:MAG: hypothetical protein WC604_03630 [Candidatus Gracilibacteria bacterium]